MGQGSGYGEMGQGKFEFKAWGLWLGSTRLSETLSIESARTWLLSARWP